MCKGTSISQFDIFSLVNANIEVFSRTVHLQVSYSVLYKVSVLLNQLPTCLHKNKFCKLFCNGGFKDPPKIVKTTMVRGCCPMVHRDQLVFLRTAGLRPKFSKSCLFERRRWRAPFELKFRYVVVFSTTPSYQCC